MTQGRGSDDRWDMISGDSRAPVAVAPGERGLSRPPLPTTRSLVSRSDVIAVDVDERMDRDAAIEAAAPPTETLWQKSLRTAIVVTAGVVAWWLLPHDPAPRPPIALPDALQGDVAAAAADLAAENRAIEALRTAGPHAAIPLLQACIDSGRATHRAWRTYLTVLEQLDRDGEFLARARAYAAAHPDRLEAAHFVARALVRQDIDAHRGGVLGYVSDAFKAELHAAQGPLERARELLAQHRDDWPSRTRTAWRDLLLLDAARLHHAQWLCDEAPFEHEFRDRALENLGGLEVGEARNALQLRLEIYRRVAAEWGFASDTRLGGTSYSYDGLRDEIGRLEAALREEPEGPAP